MPSLTNDAFMRFIRRAEVVDRAKLVATFVDAGPLMTLLSGHDHQVLYGRRGTGKTHALSYLVERQLSTGDAAVYVDLRNIGSSGGIYADPAVPLAERGTRLLMDTFAALHDGLVDFSLEAELPLQEAGPILDDFADAITEVTIVGTAEREAEDGAERVHETRRGAGVDISPTLLELNMHDEDRVEDRTLRRTRRTDVGIERHRVHFGRVGGILERFSRSIAPRRVWLVLDEWSSVPLELQPFLADLLRRSVLPVRGYTVKIGAIEQRSRFQIALDGGDYLGMELGADVTADVNLDDFMVFENDPNRAKVFFSELLYKHYRAAVGDGEESGDVARSASQLTGDAFTQVTALDEFIRATEGVPRDAINIIGLAAQRALDDPISVNHIRTAAKAWYQRDKEAAVSANPRAHALLHWVIDEVIGDRRARAFLLRRDVAHPLIDSLFDARVLHILKKSISAHDQPGIRYDVYKLDYGCYVDLVTTARSPQGLLPLDSEARTNGATSYVEVPPDDYRSIRRAILDLERFERETTAPEDSG